MKGLLINAVVFIAGAGLGAVVSWKLLDDRYKRITNEEIESVKEVYRKKFESKTSEPDKAEARKIEPQEDPEKKEYAELIKKLGYSDEEVKDTVKKKPYIIAPEEFGELDDYETISLTYYSDGVLTDDQDEPIEDVDKLVGKDFATHYGEYEDDSVYIRNDELKTDYEILADSRRYNYPYPTEDE
jgi:hypothetical protein